MSASKIKELWGLLLCRGSKGHLRNSTNNSRGHPNRAAGIYHRHPRPKSTSPPPPLPPPVSYKQEDAEAIDGYGYGDEKWAYQDQEIAPDDCANMRSSTAREKYYYQDGAEAGPCLLLLVENTIFKVHRFSFLKELSEPAPQDPYAWPGNDPQGVDQTPIMLTDTADQFRDLLWALYASPTDFAPPPEWDEPLISRLLNIALLSNKYSLSSYEHWAVDQLYYFTRLASRPLLCNIPSSTITQILQISLLCAHKRLRDGVCQYLVAQILWCDFAPEQVLPIAEQHNLRRLLGACYYVQLIQLEQRIPPDFRHDKPITRLDFPPTHNLETRLRFLSAHHSLIDLWNENLHNSPPSIPVSTADCESPSHCVAAWHRMWWAAERECGAQFEGSAHVLGRLKAMRAVVKELMAASPPQMSVSCSLAALETLGKIRDAIIEGLTDRFSIP